MDLFQVQKIYKYFIYGTRLEQIYVHMSSVEKLYMQARLWNISIKYIGTLIAHRTARCKDYSHYCRETQTWAPSKGSGKESTNCAIVANTNIMYHMCVIY